MEYYEAEDFILEALEEDRNICQNLSIEPIATLIMGIQVDSTYAEIMDTVNDLGADTATSGQSIAVAGLMRRYTSVEKKIARQDNWLHPENNVEYKSNYQAGYRVAMAKFLLEKGEIGRLQLDASYSSWREYSNTFKDLVPVGVYHLQHTTCSEFISTIDGVDVQYMLAAEVLYSTGQTAHIVWEGNLDELSRAVLGA